MFTSCYTYQKTIQKLHVKLSASANYRAVRTQECICLNMCKNKYNVMLWISATVEQSSCVCVCVCFTRECIAAEISGSAGQRHTLRWQAASASILPYTGMVWNRKSHFIWKVTSGEPPQGNCNAGYTSCSNSRAECLSGHPKIISYTAVEGRLDFILALTLSSFTIIQMNTYSHMP